jgi:hypothetical protein
MNPGNGSLPAAGAGVETGSGARDGYEPPSFEVICLACEISAYAPDGDTPLF